jgi:predicted DNA-binding transcriptional regulator AlpA
MRSYLRRPFRTWPKWPRGQSCVLAEPCVARATSNRLESTPANTIQTGPILKGARRQISRKRRSPFEFISGPKLRAKLGISAVTLWRWRHDKEKGFPTPKVINGRLYFPVTAVSAWIATQADAA